MDYLNFHLIEVRYLGATNTKGSRIKMISSRFEQSVTIPYNYEFNSGRDIALDWLSKQGHNVIGSGDVNGRDVIVVASTDKQFKPLKEV